MRIWLFFSCLILLSATSLAQNSSLAGQVINQKNQQAIQGAKVFLDKYEAQATRTDANGNFTLSIPSALASSAQVKVYIIPPNTDIRIPRQVRVSNAVAVFPIFIPENTTPEANSVEEEENSEENQPAELTEPENSETANENQAPTEELEAMSETGERPDPIRSKPKNDTLKSLEKISSIENALSELKARLAQEKEIIIQRSAKIKEQIDYISQQLRDNQEITPDERSLLIQRLEELEQQLQENTLAYQRLQKTTQEEISQMKALIGAKEFAIPWNVILLLLGIILALSILVYVFFTVAKRFRKQRNQLAETLEKVSQQNEEINQQSEEITAQRDALMVQNQRLEELQKSKEDLTAMIAHDLRNPLNIIIGYSNPDSLEKAPDDKAMLRSSYIYQASKRINVLIDNMIDVQKYARIGLHLEKGIHALRQATQIAIDNLYLFAEQKGLKVQNQIPQDHYARFDFNIIERVFENLLTNAIKYTPSGGSIVFETSITEEDSEDQIQIAIQDTGEGIPPDKFSEIFEPFNQLEARDFAHTSSTGLGLTFCKVAVASHGGNLRVKSTLGQGTTFYFNLPKATPAYQDQTTSMNEGNESSAQALTLQADEKQMLLPYVEELSRLELYEDSELRKILTKIDDQQRENIALWKSAVQDAIDSLNEDRFNELMKLNNL